MISLSDTLKIVYLNLSHKKLRAFLTISGIVIGVFVLIFFIFLSAGLKDAIYNQFSFSGFNVIGVQSAQEGGVGEPSGRSLTRSDILKIKSVAQNYKYVQGGLFYSKIVKYKKGSKEISSPLLFLAYEDWNKAKQDVSLVVDRGRFVKNNDGGVVAFGGKVENNFVEKEGEKLNLFESIKIDDKKYKIVGFLKKRGDLFIDGTSFVSMSELRKISQIEEGYTIIRISYNDGINLDRELERLDIALNGRNQNKKQKYVFSTPKEAIERVGSITVSYTHLTLPTNREV